MHVCADIQKYTLLSPFYFSVLVSWLTTLHSTMITGLHPQERPIPILSLCNIYMNPMYSFTSTVENKTIKVYNLCYTREPVSSICWILNSSKWRLFLLEINFSFFFFLFLLMNAINQILGVSPFPKFCLLVFMWAFHEKSFHFKLMIHWCNQ